MFFILSTGRSGSTTIARTLSAVPGVVCLHEPEPVLVEEAKQYVEGRMPREQAVALLRRTRVSPSPGALYGESNYALAFLADALCEAFPDACYVWLVRNGLDAVASFEHRRTYRGFENIHGRNMPFGDAVGDMSPEQWHSLGPFARCCWRWSWTNRRIRDVLTRAGVRRFELRLEDMEHRLHELASFLGVTVPADLRVPRANVSRAKVSKCQYWDRRQRRRFEEICGPLMDELYPGWRGALSLSPARKLRNEALSYLSYRKPTGRALRWLLQRTLPERIRAPLGKLLGGRGVLDYAGK